MGSRAWRGKLGGRGIDHTSCAGSSQGARDDSKGNDCSQPEDEDRELTLLAISTDGSTGEDVQGRNLENLLEDVVSGGGGKGRERRFRGSEATLLFTKAVSCLRELRDSAAGTYCCYILLLHTVATYCCYPPPSLRPI